MDKKINSTDVGERINDTKKEIAQLSEELEKLIKSNAGLSNVNFERGQCYVENVNTITSTHIGDAGISNKITPVNVELPSKKASASGKTIMLPVVKSKTKSESACIKKNIAHSKESTREFMRQQKEKREDQRKKTNSKNKIDLELKKQKLLELQQKSTALVQRNIQLKRERSKSREGRQQIRIDKSNVPSNSSDSLAKNLSNSCLPHRNIAPEVFTKNPLKLQERSKIDPKKRNENENEFNRSGLNSSQLLKGSKSILSENEEINSGASKTELDLAARKIQAFYKDYQNRKKIETRKQLENYIGENPIKESKETQTSTQKQVVFPAWLQPPTIDPYPCNFINTIKKKLQLVVNSPVRSKDIGIQSSIVESQTNIQKLNENSQNLEKENSRTDKKAASHSQKETNLDADALQHFALINFREKYSQKNKEHFRSDSESDTSKNIPEISTESGLVSNEKHMLVEERRDKVLPINTDKIKNLTLRKPMDKDLSGRQENISKKSYTFNFSVENNTKNLDISSGKIQTEESDSKPSIRSPRDSILSFNISFNNDSGTPSIVSQKNKQLAESTSDEEIKTEKSNISYYSEKENSRRKLIFTQEKSIASRGSNYENENDTGANSKKLNDIVSPSNLSSNSMKTSPAPRISGDNRNSSHSSGRSSKHNLKKGSNSKKKEKFSGKYETQLKPPVFESVIETFNKGTNKECNSDSSEVIITSSVISTISTSSTKFSSSSNLAVPLATKNEIDPPEVKIQSLLNSLISNKSKMSNSAYVSEVDVSRHSSKMAQTFFDRHVEEFSLVENNTNKQIAASVGSEKEQSFNEKMEPKKSNSNEINSQVVKDFKSKVVQSKSDTNEIHLKFEAEVHLLNDFNESLKQFMAVEKAFETLKNKNESSFRNSSKTCSALILSGDSRISTNLSKNIGSTINTSRGSDLDESHLVENSLFKSHLKYNNNLEMPSMQESTLGNSSFSFNENIPNNPAGLSIKMFEQFIKDEDVRIENLKTIIKIREQALLDRTKGELAWLEIQRKHLKETGKLHEASLVKKKQRGILLKHQQERREMQRLKQLQKIQSNERKTILKEQKDLIKAQLTSEKLISELKIQNPRKQRPSGPLKVLKASESHSETSLSRRASDAEEIFSITSRSRSIKLSEVDSSREFVFKQENLDIKTIGDSEDIDNMKRALLVRQASLMKRRKAVDDLLKRHQKLLEEEKKIKELEMAANAIIMQLPTKKVTTREPKIKSHLRKNNQKVIPLGEDKPESTIGTNSSRRKDESQILNKTNVSQSEYSFNTFYENAKATIDKMKIKQSEKEEIESSNSNFQEENSAVEYSEDFESDKHIFETESNEDNISSISELIEDFTQIEQGITMFSKQFSETAFDRSSSFDKKGELFKISSSHDTKTTMNISSVFKEEPVDSSENLRSAAISHTTEVQTENDVINSFEDEKISTFHDSQTSITVDRTSSEPEEKISKEISSNEMSDDIINIENIPTEFSKYSSDYTQEKNEENEKSYTENELLKVIVASGEIPESYVNILMKKDDPTEQIEPNKTSEIISISNKSVHSKSKIEDQGYNENISSQMILKNSEVNASIEIDELNLNEENNESIDNHLISDGVITEKVISTDLILTESAEDGQNSSDFESSNKNEYTSTEIIGMRYEDGEHKKNSRKTPESIPIESISQSICSENRPKDKISSKNEELSMIEKRTEYKISDFLLDAEILSENIVSAQKDFTNGIVKSITIEESSDLSNDKENQDIYSLDKEETYKDIPSIENNSEPCVSEMKTDDTTNKDISEIKDNPELNLAKEDFELEYDEEKSSAKQNSNEPFDASADNEHLEYGPEETKHSQEKIIENVTDAISFESVELDKIESGNDLISNGSWAEVSETVSGVIGDHTIGDISQTKISSIEADNKLEMTKGGSNVDENQEDKMCDKFESNYASIEEKTTIDNSSSNSYTDDFEDDKEEYSFIQELADTAEKSTSKTTLKIEKDKKLSETDEHDVLMVKIDLTIDTSKKEAKIIIMKEDSNAISDLEEQQGKDKDNLKTPVQQRVSQILESTIGSQKSPRDKNTRYQDYYVTTYEDVTPVNSPESAFLVKSNQLASINTFNNEAEELLKKQLAIELEIKHLEQQQKEQLPFVYIREIPNKPPPPYTPPSTQSNVITILPSRVEDLKEICRYSAKVLYNAYLSNNLNAVTFSETHFTTINETKCTKECCLFVFDLCREIAENHYQRFQTKRVPLWSKLPKEACLILGKPFTYHQLENHIHVKVKELLGFEKMNIKENSIVRWSKKKKDHVDEILVLESQAEEQEWLNYDNDELMVKNDVTDAILDFLLSETVEIYRSIFS